MCGLSEKVAICKPGKEPSQNPMVSSLILGFPSKYPIWCFAVAAQADLYTN